MAGTKRCEWCGTDPLYVAYHDQEWGVPVRDDRRLFEFLILEGAQAGLSWITILRKRENYRQAFAQFDPEKVARFSEKKIATLLQNPGIIRNQAKVRAAVHNAGLFLDLVEECGSFYEYSMRYLDGKHRINRFQSPQEIPATTAESDAFSKDLKKRGFKFVGSTVLYAHMQAAGMVNDHVVDCFRYKEVSALMKRN